MNLEIEKTYQAHKYEDLIYEMWEKSGAFQAKKSKNSKPFVISMPPPNATGILHLGHASMLALQDIMIRHHRMLGEDTLWIPGTDHASIATQNKVEKIIAEKGETRHSLGRKVFLEKVEEYVKNSQSIIRNQIRKMGASCDWTRERYTMDKGLSDAVQEVFIRMYNDGLIYKGDRIVNWCPRCESTLANDEVNHKETKAKLYWIKYGPFEVATTRPETMLGDTAVAVNPKDERYKQMIGKKYTINGPIGDFDITVIADRHVDIKFGSGAVKVTPSHSFADFDMAQKNGIKGKTIINEQGKMLANCGKYKGLTTIECRKEIVEDLKKMNLLIKVEDYENSISQCYRCDHTIEPLISKQWFIDVDKKVIEENGIKKSIKEKSIEVVKEKDIEIIPSKFEKTYYHWMENLHDWCISRQILFGHRIPIWYCENCNEIHGTKTKPSECKKCGHKELIQDPDTLDTWFSSGLWTFSTLGWPNKKDELEYFHPTSVMETGYDILFFWVARMIIMTTYTLGEIPFQKVYLHGLIRDKNGKKMSKSTGNGIDPLKMIEKYGTDAVRLSLVIGSTPGNDMRLYEEKIAGYRNFINKIWNAARFAIINVEKKDLKIKFTQESIKTSADKWIMTELEELISEVNKNMENMLFSEAGMKIYNFIWGKYCDWYLEMSKAEGKNPAVLIYVLKTCLKLLHPFTPFITEKLWEMLDEEKMLIITKWPKENNKNKFNEEHKNILFIQETINQIRKTRSELKVDPVKKIDCIITSEENYKIIKENLEIIKAMARLETLEVKDKKTNKDLKSKKIFIGKTEIELPLKSMINPEQEKARLKKEIERKEKFIKGIEGKLNNKNFVENAPEDIILQNKERLKKETIEIKKLKEELVQI